MKRIVLIPISAVAAITFLSGCSWGKEIKSYRATYSEPCGRSLLVLETENGKKIAVQTKGESPVWQLSQSALSNTPLSVFGYFTGKKIDDNHCGSYSEFHITRYEAAGVVSRCTVAGDWVNGTVTLYPSGLPKNKFTNSDYSLSFNRKISARIDIPLAQCREVKKGSQCHTAELPANSCDQSIYWCCNNKKPG